MILLELPFETVKQIITTIVGIGFLVAFTILVATAPRSKRPKSK